MKGEKMKIVVMGFAASGKTTFSERLSKRFGIKIMHLDTYNFLDDWVERDRDEFRKIVEEFIEADDYIIEGNYTHFAPKRFEEADIIFYFNFNRFKCLYGQLKRHIKYRGKIREEYITNCPEKTDFEFIKWILYKGRTKKRKKANIELVKKGKEFYIFKNRKQVNKYLASIGIKCQ